MSGFKFCSRLVIRGSAPETLWNKEVILFSGEFEGLCPSKLGKSQNFLGAGVPRKVADFLGQRPWKACENETKN